MLGNIKFIGELGKLEMLHEGILHKCIKQLLEKKRHVALRDQAEDLECLCQILRTVGRRLDKGKAQAWMDQYFIRIKAYMSNIELPCRIRFMLQDVVELRSNAWKPRKLKSDQGPKTIEQIRTEAAKDMGVYIGSHGIQGMGRGGMGGSGLFGRPTMNGSLSPGRAGGANLSDMFGTMPSTLMGGPSIGTGPGVIHMDNFSPGYSTNMGRQRTQQQNQGYQNQYSNNRRQDGSPNQQRHNNQSQQQPQQQQQKPQRDMGPRDMPPRFMKKSPQPGSGAGENDISLRPNINFTMFKPNSPNVLPKSAQGGTQMGMGFKSGHMTPDSTPLSGPTGPIMSKQPQITIKQVPAQDKAKANKQRATPSREEIKKGTETLLVDYLESGQVEQAVTAVRELRAPNRYLPELVTYLITETLNKADEEQEKVNKLIATLKEENMLMAEHYMDGVQRVFENMSDMEQEVPLVKSCVSRFAARAVLASVISLMELSEPMTGGAHYPLFLLCLQQIYKLKDKPWLVTAFNESKINLETMLPESDRNKERMMEILEDRGLTFIFPLLRVQTELWRQLQADPNPTTLYKWIRENVDVKLHASVGFINVLVTSILRYIIGESTLADGVDPSVTPDKNMVDKEKDLIKSYSAVLQRFLHERPDLQLTAVYALQVHCHTNKFPKGMLLRLFMQLYDLEVIEEEQFLRWKEEVNNDYPGKGKALFQVNQWLTWLEQAEEESEEDEEE